MAVSIAGIRNRCGMPSLRQLLCAVVLGVSVTAITGPAAVEARPKAKVPLSCYTPAERRAAKVRVLQTELMVAALHCRDQEDLDFTGKYNEFVTRFRSHLALNAALLKAHFEHRYGKSSVSRLDRYITQLANALSKDAVSSRDYCSSRTPLFDQVLSLKDGELESFSEGRPVVLVAADGC